MFETPTYDLWAVLYTAVGATSVWARLGRKKMRVFALSRLIEGLDFSDKTKLIAEFCIFVSMGVVVGVGVVQPTTAAQALAAGMGWTGLLAQPPSS